MTLPRLLLAFGLTVAVAVPLVAAAVTGSLSIPHNDAWAYSRIAEHFGQTGQLRLLHWNRSALVGQIVVLGPLASSITVQHLFIAALTIVAILCCYDLLAGTLGQHRAALATLILALWPEIGLLGTSFMSDIPALAATLACLALGRRALARESMLLLAGSLLIGFWGFTVREQVIAAPAAVLFVAIGRAARRRGFRLILVMGLAAALAVAAAGFEMWRRSLPGDDPPKPMPLTPVLPLVTDLAVRGYFLLALAVAPAVLLVARPWRWRLGSWVAAACAAGAAALAWHDLGPEKIMLTFYVDARGPYPTVMLGERAMVDHPVILVVALAAVIAGVLLAGVLVERGRSLPPMLGWFLAFTVAGTLVTRANGQVVYGRYLVVLIPVLLAITLSEPPARDPWLWPSRVVAGAMLAVLAGLSLTVTSFGSAFDAARWGAGQQMAATGVPAADIDAGFEWTGYHSPDGIHYFTTDPYPLVNFYTPRFSGNRPCYVVASSPQPTNGWVLEQTVGYRPFVFLGEARLWTYRTPYCR